MPGGRTTETSIAFIWGFTLVNTCVREVLLVLFAIVVGVIFMITGLGMGVSMVLLPVGIPLGLAGLLFFLWGFFGWSESGPSRAGSSARTRARSGRRASGERGRAAIAPGPRRADRLGQDAGVGRQPL